MRTTSPWCVCRFLGLVKISLSEVATERTVDSSYPLQNEQGNITEVKQWCMHVPKHILLIAELLNLVPYFVSSVFGRLLFTCTSATSLLWMRLGRMFPRIHRCFHKVMVKWRQMELARPSPNDTRRGLLARGW